MRVLTNGRENSAVRESEKHHEEVEGLDALLPLNSKCFQMQWS
jgi:hypothetical protein